jgi:hypothetical protein
MCAVAYWQGFVGDRVTNSWVEDELVATVGNILDDAYCPRSRPRSGHPLQVKRPATDCAALPVLRFWYPVMNFVPEIVADPGSALMNAIQEAVEQVPEKGCSLWEAVD